MIFNYDHNESCGKVLKLELIVEGYKGKGFIMEES